LQRYDILWIYCPFVQCFLVFLGIINNQTRFCMSYPAKVVFVVLNFVS